ncbi:MAG: hypothetical protein U0790_22640 [Isosphaeraceae bacterium]
MPAPAFNPRLKAAILDILENQLRDNDPPETKATLERLLAQGIDPDEARRLIGCVIVGELFIVLKSSTAFDRERFTSRLALLPEMPWFDEEPDES